MQAVNELAAGYVIPLIGGVNAALLAAVFQKLGDVAATLRALDRRVRSLEEETRRQLQRGHHA